MREGAEAMADLLNQCHNARPGSEFAPYQWDQIMMHMRAMPNMPAQGCARDSRIPEGWARLANSAAGESMKGEMDANYEDDLSVGC